MDQARSKQIRAVKRTVGQIDALRKRVSEARSAGRAIPVNNALEYTLINSALECLRDQLSATTAMRLSDSP